MTVEPWWERHERAIIALLAAGLTVISLIPVWAVHFPPLQDYPLHLLRAHIIAHYSAPSSHYYDTFVVSLFPIPYILTDYIVAGLALFLPVATAGKILLSVYVVLLPMSVFYLLRSIAPAKPILGFFGFLFIYNWHFAMGFMSFFFSFPLFLFAVGYWWRHRLGATWRHRVVFSALVFCVYLAHMYTFLFLLFSVGVLSLTESRSLRRSIDSLLPFLPSLVLLVLTFWLQAPQFQRGPTVIGYPSLVGRLRMIATPKLDFRFFETYSPDRERHIFLAAGLLACLLLPGSLRALRKNSFGWLFLGLTLLYFSLPAYLSTKGLDYLSIRVLIFMAFIGILCLEPPKRALSRGVAMGYLVALSLVSLAGTFRDYRRINRELQDYSSVMMQIPSGERVSFRVDRHRPWPVHSSPYYYFCGYYYIEKGEGQTPQLEGCCAGVLRSLRYRHPEVSSPDLEGEISLWAVDVGGHAIIVYRDQRAAVDALEAQYGFKPEVEAGGVGIYVRQRSVPPYDPEPGPYDVSGLKNNYNYLFLWQDPSRTDRRVAEQFELVTLRGNAQLWRRRRLLDERSAIELCIPCGDQPGSSRPERVVGSSRQRHRRPESDDCRVGAQWELSPSAPRSPLTRHPLDDEADRAPVTKASQPFGVSVRLLPGQLRRASI
jgi:hypothetical protein